ncbi:X-ray repair cross complementing protein 2, xrcc2, putative [Ricinus communis]|uniref:X-ray repair cross complementing protein 2, xrcc2, putative n=1 Tax=Ricinus communis TaxID=3988 RepID=B9RPZ1_RICCO|nr:X-ray repair cross complementing protein 2, xrcc2, putative [Ricinus communis]
MSNGIRGWIEGDESGREMLSRVQKERPYLHLPPPFHKVPIRVGNVIEVIGSSPSAKTHILMQSATHCILPQYCGGLGRLVFFVDLDCRFDILRLSQILKNRIIQTNGSDDEEIFGACMRRFRYIRCYDSLEFLATLKTLRHQIQRDREAQGITISCMMIDSIGAFHWVDRASTSFLGDNSRKGFSLQNVWETIVQEIKKLLLVHPMLVIAAKATILGNRYAANNIKCQITWYQSQELKKLELLVYFLGLGLLKNIVTVFVQYLGHHPRVLCYCHRPYRKKDHLPISGFPKSGDQQPCA